MSMAYSKGMMLNASSAYSCKINVGVKRAKYKGGGRDSSQHINTQLLLMGARRHVILVSSDLQSIQGRLENKDFLCATYWVSKMFTTALKILKTLCGSVKWSL